MQTQYEYKALASDGATLTGTLTAAGTAQVEEYLQEHDLVPVSIAEARARSILSLPEFLRRTDYEKLILFTNSLSTMYRAGIPLLRSLRIMRIGKKNGPFNRALEQIRLRIQSGLQLSEAMEDFKELFSDVYRACITAGEESGKLDDTLIELSDMLEREQDLNRQVKSAVRYPVIVIVVICLAFFVLMTFVIPRFVDFYSSFNAALPLPTRIMIRTSQIITTYWPLIPGLVIAVGFGLRKLLSHPTGRRWVDRKLLTIPVIGELILKGNVARFCLMFRILFRSGLPLVRSLSILAKTIKNIAITNEIALLENLMQRGSDIDAVTEEFDFFPEQALHMIAIGLESGNLDKMLKEIGDHYSKEVMYTSRQLTSIIEPVLTLVLGGFVLLLALAIFLPMWNLIKVFSG